MKLMKCPTCGRYTFKEKCPSCEKETVSPHYKFKEIRDAPKDSSEYFLKKRSRKVL